MQLTEPEIFAKNEMRALTTDAQGRYCYVGLNNNESKELFSLEKNWNKSREEKVRAKELRDRHEIFRLSVIAAEQEIRVNRPDTH